MIRKSPHIVLGATLLLVVLGLVMLVSIGPYTKDGALDPYHDLKSQAKFMGVGLVLMVCAICTDYRRYQQWSWGLYILAALLLGLCFVPGVGRELNGSRRWIGYGSASIQPSEIAKIVAVMAVAAWCARFSQVRRSLIHGFVYPLLIMGGLCVLIGLEVDLGNACLLTLGSLSVLYAGGARLRYLAVLVVMGVGAIVAAVRMMPERMDRVLAVFDLEKFKQGDGLQQWLSLTAFGCGGDGGLGLGNSRQKMWALPYANSDFISAIIGEELGLGFMLAMVVCYVLIAVFGVMIALHAPDRFGKLLGFGLVTLMIFQALIHLAVTTGVAPNKGMPLPFVSAGGSNLVCLLLSLGILLNIYRQGRHVAYEPEPVLRRKKLTPAL